MSTGLSRYEMRRAIEEILDDSSLPRHLQVGRILDLFEDQLLGRIFEVPEESPEEPPEPAAKAMKKKRAKRKKA